MNTILNGWNDNRSRSSGVGGGPSAFERMEENKSNNMKQRLLALLNRIAMSEPEIVGKSAGLMTGRTIPSADFNVGDINKPGSVNILQLYKPSLELIKDRLLECEEFRGVKKINFLAGPTFIGDASNGDPIEMSEDYLGGPTKFYETGTYLSDPEKPVEIELSETVDIYNISTIPQAFELSEIKNLPVGVYLLPSNMYSTMGLDLFARVDFGAMAVAGIEYKDARERAKRVILKKMEELLDSGEPNIPRKYSVKIRMSHRSIKKGPKEERNVFETFSSEPQATFGSSINEVESKFGLKRD